MNHRLPILLASGVLAAGCWAVAQGQFTNPSDSIRTRDRGAGGQRPAAYLEGTQNPAGPGSTIPTPTQPGAASPPGSPTPSLSRPDLNPTPPAPPSSPPDGNALLRQSIRELQRQPAIECRVRQRLWLYGHQYIGSGHYRQLGQGPNKLLLWELKMEIHGEITSLKQVSDRRYLWITRNFADRTEQSLVDLRRIQKARDRSASSPAALPATPWLAVGGVPRLLEGLGDYFQFEDARSDNLGEYPVWVLEGRWAPPGREAEDSQLPPHVPHRVRLVLGRDPVLPLFPYRIEFEREETVDGKSRTAPLLRMEFFEIHRAPLVPEQFAFDPGDNPVVDETERYIEILGLKEHSQEN